ncbi:MAG: hypothetical protein ACD_76C00035G0002 [uncultured bacterium]|nr:MAG: hypothetical protein ACD_76C00035G0002 [uncultured bacterium]HBD05362.1 translation initiation factor IF-2 [Candidatus Uhrbacteria bacterium]
MNISALARRLNVSSDELKLKLPELGFPIGARAIKVNEREAQKIIEAWAEMKRREVLKVKMEQQKAVGEEKAEKSSTVELPPAITVRELASRIDQSISSVMQVLMKNGVLVSLNERIDFDTAAIVAGDLGFEAVLQEKSEQKDDEEMLKRAQEIIEKEDKSLLLPRPPVVVVMGHVDHGKTKLLDAVRKTHIMESEAGGITQHIGAYQVERNGRQITFIDTPGHEAFTVMRSRGAKVADIAIIVVAADDGVQPQTKEAIDIARAAKLPFMVALNKIDKPDANVERVKGELAQLNVVSEAWGGKTVMVPISAKNMTGIEELLDMLLLIADLEKENIVANPNRPAMGTVIESHLDKNEGPLATMLVQTGTLKVGDMLGIKGVLYGKVKSMRDYKNAIVNQAPPSMPVRILGFKVPPAVGDVAEVPKNESDLRKTKLKLVKTTAVSGVGAVTRKSSDEKPSFTIVIRADVVGSLEAILGMTEKIKHPSAVLKIVGKGLGNVSDADIMQAEATGAVVYAFNTEIPASVMDLAREKNVEVVIFNVIYHLFDDIAKRFESMLPKEVIIKELGGGEVLALFRKSDAGAVVGVKVTKGKIEPQSVIRIMRKNEIVGEGTVLELRIGKEKMTEVKQGQECGILVKGKAKIEVGDLIEAYKEERREAKFNITEQK